MYIDEEKIVYMDVCI